MICTRLPYIQNSTTYSISEFDGNLYAESFKKQTSNRIDRKVKAALDVCFNPYHCGYQRGFENFVEYDTKNLNLVERYHNRFIFLGNSAFYLSRLYANLHAPLFKNTHLAMAYISQLKKQRENKATLCLQKTLTAAKTSKSFKESGVLFIGAFLPTASMHAWIIEDGFQPDENDREWILYRPLLALHY